MSDSTTRLHRLIHSLEERKKELNCLYQVEELLTDPKAKLQEVMQGIAVAVQEGMQYPKYCRVQISLAGIIYFSEGFQDDPENLQQDIFAQEEIVGRLAVCYTQPMPQADCGPFLKEEVKLVGAVADLIGHFHMHQTLRQMAQVVATAKGDLEAASAGGWRIVMSLLNRTDRELFLRISRKMINYLCWRGVAEAEEILHRFGFDRRRECCNVESSENRPSEKIAIDPTALGEEIFEIAARNLSDDEILECLQKWMVEDKSKFLVQTLVDPGSTHSDVQDAIERFKRLSPNGGELSESIWKGIIVALINRFLSSQLEFIKIAKNYLTIDDFYRLIEQLIYSQGSRGALGGKGSGLFLATHILEKLSATYPELRDVRAPRTWYVTSDGLFNFLHFNNMEEITEQKYKSPEQVRQEYPNIVHMFKNSYFPPDMIKGLSTALDDLGDKPLIVRSSSLLEDRFGATFSGKYKSLFLANQGAKQERLESLMDAIAEVYASVYNSDPIEYRAERGLLDFSEEMGVMIQEVVGTRVGNCYLPSYAGVAFSNNDFRWSPRIRRTDGLVRLVPGLGTRAVDRTSDDYAILIAPGQPNLQVSISIDEQVRYSPRRIDLINLESNRFETHELKSFLHDHGEELPEVERLISVVDDGRIRSGSLMAIDFENDHLIVTAEGLIRSTPFLSRIKSIMQRLQEVMGTPVDIEFASDGKDLYLLQCRPQGRGSENLPSTIPHDLPREDILFTAKRYVSNGRVPDISHIVYVPPQQYGEIADIETLLDVGRVISRLNMILPKRQFVLMGPGRWGSRGDVKLGVSVTYSDINNTAMLIEIGIKKGNYLPELSFGTHFFQDLVEAQIRYLPLYPDDKGIIFNEDFLLNSINALPALLPEFESLQNVVRVIDVPVVNGGGKLRILMNGDLGEAVGFLSKNGT